MLPICAQIEEEIVEMDKEEKELFLADMGLEESGLDRLIKECYALLGLISYLTAGKQEVRAWTIKNGTKAPQAAGKIHSDFERGFIRAEVIAYDDLIACGSGKGKRSCSQRRQGICDEGRRRRTLPFQRIAGSVTLHPIPAFLHVCLYGKLLQRRCQKQLFRFFVR